MKSWHRYAICITLGLVGGAGYAVSQIRGNFAENQIRNGPWRVNTNQGTASATVLTRAKVALNGLLALPAKEAMYYLATVDSEGKPLNGRCTYTLRGEEFDARWWSLTLYQGEGWLVPNKANKYSVGSGSLIKAESKPAQWIITVGPDIPEELNGFIPTGGVPKFDLTLRVYHPQGVLLNDPVKAKLPTIKRERCS